MTMKRLMLVWVMILCLVMTTATDILHITIGEKKNEIT
jgi:hypothetical protein